VTESATRVEDMRPFDSCSASAMLWKERKKKKRKRKRRPGGNLRPVLVIELFPVLGVTEGERGGKKKKEGKGLKGHWVGGFVISFRAIARNTCSNGGNGPQKGKKKGGGGGKRNESSWDRRLCPGLFPGAISSKRQSMRREKKKEGEKEGTTARKQSLSVIGEHSRRKMTVRENVGPPSPCQVIDTGYRAGEEKKKEKGRGGEKGEGRTSNMTRLLLTGVEGEVSPCHKRGGKDKGAGNEGFALDFARSLEEKREGEEKKEAAHRSGIGFLRDWLGRAVLCPVRRSDRVVVRITGGKRKRGGRSVRTHPASKVCCCIVLSPFLAASKKKEGEKGKWGRESSRRRGFKTAATSLRLTLRKDIALIVRRKGKRGEQVLVKRIQAFTHCFGRPLLRGGGERRKGGKG